MLNSPFDAPAVAQAQKRLERDQVSSALSKQDPGQRSFRLPIARRDSAAGSGLFLAWHWHRGPDCTSLLCRTPSGRNWTPPARYAILVVNRRLSRTTACRGPTGLNQSLSVELGMIRTAARCVG